MQVQIPPPAEEQTTKQVLLPQLQWWKAKMCKQAQSMSTSQTRGNAFLLQQEYALMRRRTVTIRCSLERLKSTIHIPGYIKSNVQQWQV